MYIKVADSGHRRERTKFLRASVGPVCTPHRLEENPGLYNLRWGTVNRRSQLVPGSQGFCRSRAQWSMNIAEIPRTAYRIADPVAWDGISAAWLNDLQ